MAQGTRQLERRNGWGPWVLLLVWASLVAMSILAVASLASAQTGGVADDGAVVGEPPSADELGEVFAEGEANAAEVVELSEVDWAGMVWQTEHGVVPAVLMSAEVDVRVTGIVARARLTQRFENPGDEWLEALYLFPLPEDAAVDHLRMVIGPRVIEGQIHEKEEAKQIYEQAKAEGKKASLVEQARPNMFTSRVANVGPHEKVEVVIELQQTVRYDGGEMSLRFPTVVNPRYTPPAPSVEQIDPPLLASADEPLPVDECDDSQILGVTATAHAGTSRARQVDDGYALASHVAEYLAPSMSQATVALFPGRPAPPPVNPVRFTVTLDAGFPLDYLDSPYHAVDVEDLGRGRYRVTLSGEGVTSANRDFELVWAPQLGSEPRTAVFREEHDGAVYSLLMVLPPQGDAAGWRPLDREMIFIVDSSGSMHGASMEQARLALNATLDGLRPGDSFNVIDFDDRARALFPGSLAATPQAVAKAREWVASLEAEGGTNMLPALAAALEGPPSGYPDSGARTLKQVVFLTDGAVGNEEALFEYIHQHLGEARLFTVGIGSAPNSLFMARAAEEGRGTYTYIGDPEEVAFKVEKLVRKLEGPVLADLEVQWDDPSAEVWPARLPDLYAGEPLVVAARTTTGGDTVEVRGRRDGVYWQDDVELAAASTASGGGSTLGGPTAGVRQLWARRKIASLMASLASGADRDEVRRRVIEVALLHHLVSQFTSLVAVDVTPSRPAADGLAPGAVPTPMPAGWTPPGSLPVGGTGWTGQVALGFLLLLLAAALLAVRPRHPVGAAADRASAGSRGRRAAG